MSDSSQSSTRNPDRIDTTHPPQTGKIEFRPSEIPIRLRECSQWVCWKQVTKLNRDKPTKIPVTPADTQAAVNDPSTWGSFEAALRGFSNRAAIDGIGFVFSGDDPFVGIDLDDCRDRESGALEEWARDVITRVDTYTEVSPSGTGLHCLCETVRPGKRRRRGAIELYDSDRYFTVTGQRLAPERGQPQVARRPHAIEQVYEQYLAPEPGSESEAADSSSSAPDAGGADPLAAIPEDDRELIERAKRAANGAKFTRLWEGRWEGEYPSHSEADLALCDILAFWTQKDRNRMDRLFRQSGLMRPKWDAQRGERTYGELTLTKALDRIDDSKVYDPTYYS